MLVGPAERDQSASTCRAGPCLTLSETVLTTIHRLSNILASAAPLRDTRSRHEHCSRVSRRCAHKASVFRALTGCSYGNAGPGADLYEDVDPSPLTAEESDRVPHIATEAYQILYSQDNRVRLLRITIRDRADNAGRACSWETSLPSYGR